MKTYYRLLGNANRKLSNWYNTSADPKELTQFYYLNGVSYWGLTIHENNWFLVTGSWQLVKTTEGIIIELAYNNI